MEEIYRVAQKLPSGPKDDLLKEFGLCDVEARIFYKI